MKQMKIKNLMIPLDEYAVVKDDATLYQAVLALEEAQKRFCQQSHPDRSRTDEATDSPGGKPQSYQHRAVLVEDKDGNIVGKVSQLDLLRGLETGYNHIGDLSYVSHSGINPKFIRSLIQQYNLWQDPLDQICGKSTHITVKDIMYTPSEGEYVDEEDTLDQAIHQLVMGRHQSLLVTREHTRIVGILRLVDVFSEVCRVIKQCRR